MSGVLTAEQEIRLQIVTALTRTDGSLARNQPEQFIQSVAKIATYVVIGSSTEKPEPEPGAPEVRKGRGKGVTADKGKTEAGNDFME